MTSIYKNTQYNGKVEDNLLLNGDTSFFQDTGYVRHSNFCQSYIDVVKPTKLGQTVTWTLPKGVDLLGWTDLMITLNRPKTITSSTGKTHCAWVECLGYAMIEKATLSIGNGGTIETLTGEQMNIINELFKDKEKRLNNHVLRTGVTAFPTELVANATPGNLEGKHHITTSRFNGGVGAYEHNRYSRYLGKSNSTDGEIPNQGANAAVELIVPLQWFFGRSGPSKNLPIGPIAQSSDITLTIKFRALADLITYFPDFEEAAMSVGATTAATPAIANTVPTFTWENDEVVVGGNAKIRCQVTAVSAAESAQLTNQEHVRLNTLWAEPTSQVEKVTLKSMIPVTKTGTEIETGVLDNALSPSMSVHTVAGWRTPANTGRKVKIPLNLLHPVKEIIFTIRKVHEIRPTKDEFGQMIGDGWGTSSAGEKPGQTHMIGRNYFAYQGGMLDPNVDSAGNSILNATSDNSAGTKNLVGNEAFFPRPVCQTFYGMDDLKLIINSGNYHNDLEGGLDRAYLMERIMPSQHSGCSTTFTRASLKHINSNTTQMEAMHDLKMLAGDQDRKEIYSFSFALSPESDNPSGHLNFSSVSTASLEFTLYGYHNTWQSDGKTVEEDVQIDVYPLYHNWIQMHDGRAHLSFQ